MAQPPDEEFRTDMLLPSEPPAGPPERVEPSVLPRHRDPQEVGQPVGAVIPEHIPAEGMVMVHFHEPYATFMPGEEASFSERDALGLVATGKATLVADLERRAAIARGELAEDETDAPGIVPGDATVGGTRLVKPGDSFRLRPGGVVANAPVTATFENPPAAQVQSRVFGQQALVGPGAPAGGMEPLPDTTPQPAVNAGPFDVDSEHGEAPVPTPSSEEAATAFAAPVEPVASDEASVQ